MIDSAIPVEPVPGTEQPHPQMPPETPRSRKTKLRNETTENIQEMGTTEVPTAKSNIHVMTIIGQIEGQPTMQIKPKYWSCEYILKTLRCL